MLAYLFTASNKIDGKRAKHQEKILNDFDIEIATKNFENPQEDLSDFKFESERRYGIRNDQISAMDEL